MASPVHTWLEGCARARGARRRQRETVALGRSEIGEEHLETQLAQHLRAAERAAPLNEGTASLNAMKHIEVRGARADLTVFSRSLRGGRSGFAASRDAGPFLPHCSHGDAAEAGAERTRQPLLADKRRRGGRPGRLRPRLRVLDQERCGAEALAGRPSHWPEAPQMRATAGCLTTRGGAARREVPW